MPFACEACHFRSPLMTQCRATLHLVCKRADNLRPSLDVFLPKCLLHSKAKKPEGFPSASRRVRRPPAQGFHEPGSKKSHHNQPAIRSMASKDLLMLPQVGQSLPLTPTEERLRRLLLDVADYIDYEKANAPSESSSSLSIIGSEAKDRPKIELRFTGGWVRDKLLGLDSPDIDVGINVMTGYQFGLKTKQYLDDPRNVVRHSIRPKIQQDSTTTSTQNTDLVEEVVSGEDLLGGLHKIEANPEKSKHLETVTTRIFGLDIDLVNLRKETYTEDSRNPQMEFGTAKEDALRRDATINALFYNLNESKLEDFTGYGLDDMRSKILRTPLDPHQTFKDDPLRILRLIRFASRLKFDIVSEAESAMSDESIRRALEAKISRERIGAEIEKMLKGPAPDYALELIHRLGLYDVIFTDPSDSTMPKPVTAHWDRVYKTTAWLIERPSHLLSLQSLKTLLIPSASSHYVAWLVTSLVPWSFDRPPSSDLDEVKGKGKFVAPIAATVARRGLKSPNKTYNIISAAFQHSTDVRQSITWNAHSSGDTSTHQSSPSQRSRLGLTIRRWGPNWRSAVLTAALQDVQAMNLKSEDDLESAVSNVLDPYSRFLDSISSLDLLDAHAMVPAVDGKDLVRALDSKPGQWVGEALEVVIEWQLGNANRQNDKVGAIEEVKKQRGRFIP